MVRRRDAQGTIDLLTWEDPKVVAGYADDVAGRGPLDNRIARLISRALRDAKDDHGLSRAEIARAMTEYLGRTVSPATLDKYASEAGEDRRIPLDAFAALVHATKAFDLLGFLPEMFGFAAVPAKYRDLIELHEIEQHQKDVEARAAALRSKFRGGR